MIESIILQFLPIFAPFPMIEPLIWVLLSTITSPSMTDPLFIRAELLITAVSEIILSPVCSKVAPDLITPVTRSADALTSAAGVPISSQYALSK